MSYEFFIGHFFCFQIQKQVTKTTIKGTYITIIFL